MTFTPAQVAAQMANAAGSDPATHCAKNGATVPCSGFSYGPSDNVACADTSGIAVQCPGQPVMGMPGQMMCLNAASVAVSCNDFSASYCQDQNGNTIICPTTMILYAIGGVVAVGAIAAAVVFWPKGKTSPARTKPGRHSASGRPAFQNG